MKFNALMQYVLRQKYFDYDFMRVECYYVFLRIDVKSRYFTTVLGKSFFTRGGNNEIHPK